MKICPNCGVSQEDRRSFCVECGKKLGKPVSSAEEEKMQQERDEKLERLYDKEDPLHISTSDKVAGALALAGAVVSVALLFWAEEKRSALMGLFFFLAVALTAFLPRLLWELTKMRLSLHVNEADDLTPVSGRTGRNILLWGFLLLGVVMIIATIMIGREAPPQPSVIWPPAEMGK